MRRRSLLIALSVTVLAVVALTGVVLLATQAALTAELARNEQNPVYHGISGVQVKLNQSAKAGSITLRVHDVMDGNNLRTQQVWAAYETTNYTSLSPSNGNKYTVINVTVTNVVNATSRFRFTDLALVGSDGRIYYANYAASTASCRASIANESLKAGATCGVYIAFSVPEYIAPAYMVNMASNPSVAVSLG